MLKDGKVRGGEEEMRGELKSMLIWQLQNCPWTDGKHTSEENENERKSVGHVVTDMMTHIHKTDINMHTSF